MSGRLDASDLLASKPASIENSRKELLGRLSPEGGRGGQMLRLGLFPGGGTARPAVLLIYKQRQPRAPVGSKSTAVPAALGGARRSGRSARPQSPHSPLLTPAQALGAGLQEGGVHRVRTRGSKEKVGAGGPAGVTRPTALVPLDPAPSPAMRGSRVDSGLPSWSRCFLVLVPGIQSTCLAQQSGVLAESGFRSGGAHTPTLCKSLSPSPVT